MKKIKLTQGKYALVDDEDFEFLSKWNWYYHDAGYAANDGMDNGKRTRTLMHRLLMEFPSRPLEVDHINRNRLDNRKKNLRVVTRNQNMMNMGLRKDNISGYKGVPWRPDKKKWTTYINFNNMKRIYLGHYIKIEDAIKARKAAEKQYHAINA